MIKYKGHKVYMNGEYPAIFLNGKNVHVHRLVWIDHYGDIPKNCVIHHKDENKLNWDISNLELLTRSNHVCKHRDVCHRPPIRVSAIKDGVKLIFDSIEICAKECNTHTSSINRVFKGKQKQSNGYVFVRLGE